MSNEITAHDRRRIAVVALCDERSVRRAYLGDVLGDMLRRRIVEAAAQLGLPTPPPGPPPRPRLRLAGVR